MTTTWNNCTCDIYYRDERPVLNDPGYAIRIEGDELTICYKGSQGQITYKGKDLGGGHYELTADLVEGNASVHRAPSAGVISGSWNEQGYSGMWRFHLIP